MSFLANLSIQKKLTGAILLTGVTVALLLAVIFVVIEFSSHRDNLFHQTLTLAKVIGQNNQNNVAKRNLWTARKQLAALSEEPSIRFAYIFDGNDQPIAQYINADKNRFHRPRKQLEAWLEQDQLKSHYSMKALTLLVPIFEDQSKKSSVYIQADFNAFYHRLTLIVISVAVCILLAIVTALFLSSWFQRLLSFPIMRLADKMDWISRNSDFRARAVKDTDDEVGQLVDGFNMMLDQLELHNDQLEQHKEKLEDEVALRTRELKDANLQLHTNVATLKTLHRKAKQASEAKSTFLANMSHEIRTPMIGILGTADLLAKSKLTPEQSELADILNRSGESMLQILNDILDFSKIEAGKVELDVAPFNLSKLCEEIGVLVSPQAFEKGLELVIDLAPDLPLEILGDSGRIRQILLNLLGNAIKFTESGYVRLQVVASIHKDEADIQLSIHDTGIGIAPQAKDVIFESFSQADASTTRHYGGTGLGLAIVKQLITLMKGVIDVKSEKDKGTSIHCSLNLPVVQPWIRPPQTFEEPIRILVVDNNACTADVVDAHLVSMGALVQKNKPPMKRLTA